jgi:CMP/dCMP kinase
MSDDWSTLGRLQDTGTYPVRGQSSAGSCADWSKLRGDPIDLITVSREFGAGGSDLAREVGNRLHWTVLDRDLVHHVADRLRLDPRHVEPLDEQTPSWLTRLVASTLLMTPPELHVDVDASTVINSDAVAEAARAAILAAVQTPPLVVVGHGAQCLFRNRRGALHVRLVAPLSRRVERICQRDTCDKVGAANIARRMDEARRAYVRRHYHIDVRDPLLYDLQINTGVVTIDEAADMVASIVGARVTADLG